MSIEIMSKVWKQSKAIDSQLLLLLAIADYADDQGVAFPKIPQLAQKCRQSSRSVTRHIADLKLMGELAVISGRGRGGRNKFKVLVGENKPNWRILENEKYAKPGKINTPNQAENTPHVACLSMHPSCINHHEHTHHELIPADAGKNGVSVKFQIPDLIEFSEQYLDPKLEAWLEKNAPAIPPHSTTSEFLQYHLDNKTEFQSRQHFIKAWRGWVQNAQKFVITRSKNKANKQKGNNGNGSNDKHPSRQPEPDLSFLREAGLL